MGEIFELSLEDLLIYSKLISELMRWGEKLNFEFDAIFTVIVLKFWGRENCGLDFGRIVVHIAHQNLDHREIQNRLRRYFAQLYRSP